MTKFDSSLQLCKLKTSFIYVFYRNNGLHNKIQLVVQITKANVMPEIYY